MEQLIHRLRLRLEVNNKFLREHGSKDKEHSYERGYDQAIREENLWIQTVIKDLEKEDLTFHINKV